MKRHPALLDLKLICTLVQAGEKAKNFLKIYACSVSIFLKDTFGFISFFLSVFSLLFFFLKKLVVDRGLSFRIFHRQP